MCTLPHVLETRGKKSLRSHLCVSKCVATHTGNTFLNRRVHIFQKWNFAFQKLARKTHALTYVSKMHGNTRCACITITITHGSPQENARFALCFENVRHSSSCLCSHSFASAHFQTHDDLQKNVRFAVHVENEQHFHAFWKWASRLHYHLGCVFICAFVNTWQHA